MNDFKSLTLTHGNFHSAVNQTTLRNFPRNASSSNLILPFPASSIYARRTCFCLCFDATLLQPFPSDPQSPKLTNCLSMSSNHDISLPSCSLEEYFGLPHPTPQSRKTIMTSLDSLHFGAGRIRKVI